MMITKISDTVTSSNRNIVNTINKGGRAQLLLAVGRRFYEMTQANFGTNGQYRAYPWPLLSKAYSKKVHSNVPTLLRSGELKRSVKLDSVRGNYVDIFTNDKRAAALCFGYKPRNLPSRNFFPMEIYGSPMTQRLTIKAERELFSVLTRKMTALSSNVLPYQAAPLERMRPSYGSPFNRSM